jgi:hypothetical protein
MSSVYRRYFSGIKEYLADIWEQTDPKRSRIEFENLYTRWIQVACSIFSEVLPQEYHIS